MLSQNPEIIFEDEQVLVLDKPAGMVVNKAKTTREGETVQEWIGRIFKVQYSKFKEAIQDPKFKDFYERSGIVHRLDKETSGLLLVAKTPESFANLQNQFKNRLVVKKYLALVHGKVVPERGEIRAPVGRLPWNRERFGIVPGGREAVTKYKMLRYYSFRFRESIGQNISVNHDNRIFTLLELEPLTGRTHQIRVHLKYLGHPIVGDPFYVGRKTLREDRKFCPRLFLHASFLEIGHPVSGERLSFESSLPNELKEVLSYIDISIY